ncbi:MAG: type-F conjugative transfer system secretin TraK [Acinetobacter sp.]|nr:type-F conjugative transfer system secretin TraK [Acinetobacter sp.]
MNLFKTTKIFGALLLTAASVCVSANDQIFRNAGQIPAPSKGGVDNSAKYIPVNNQNFAPPVNNLPSNFANNRTQVSQQPHQSLTNPSFVAREPISLDKATLAQQTVTIDNDDTHVVPVSNQSMNRINTPFRNPIVLVNGGAKYKVVGQDVYLVMESDQPIGVYVREDDAIANNSPVASLTLVPKAIPMQNISVVLANTLRERLSNPNAKLATDYADVIRVNMSAVAVGTLPEGYSKSNVREKTIARVGSVTLRPKAIYSGVDNLIYVYTAQNVTSQFVELSEPSFWHKGVRAVAFNEKIKLAPNETTEVIIVADTGNGDESIYD